MSSGVWGGSKVLGDDRGLVSIECVEQNKGDTANQEKAEDDDWYMVEIFLMQSSTPLRLKSSSLNYSPLLKISLLPLGT